MYHYYIYCVEAFPALLQFVFYSIVFFDLINNAGYMHEDIFFAGITLDKAKALFGVEELYCSLIFYFFHGNE